MGELEEGLSVRSCDLQLDGYNGYLIYKIKIQKNIKNTQTNGELRCYGTVWCVKKKYLHCRFPKHFRIFFFLPSQQSKKW